MLIAPFSRRRKKLEREKENVEKRNFFFLVEMVVYRSIACCILRKGMDKKVFITNTVYTIPLKQKWFITVKKFEIQHLTVSYTCHIQCIPSIINSSVQPFHACKKSTHKRHLLHLSRLEGQKISPFFSSLPFLMDEFLVAMENLINSYVSCKENVV